MTANISPHMPFRIGNIASGAREARHRIDLLDMIKAAAILMVIFCHLPIPYIRRIILFPLIVDQAVPVFIMLMGYCHAMSLDNQRTTAGKRFKHKLAKLCRFAVPWLMIILIEIVILLAGRQIPGSWPQLAEHFGKFSFGGLFLMGGYGAGGYFFYVMIQLYILIPLLDRFKGWRLLAIGFAINILFEIAVRVFDIPMHIYRITALRYVFLAASGIFLYRLRRTTWRGKLKTPLISLCIISGVAYIWLVTSGGAFSRIIGPYWPTTAMPTALFLFPALYLLMEKYETRLFWNLDSRSGRLLRFCGQKSYHIYLAQMFFFWMAGIAIACSGAPLMCMAAIILLAYPLSIGSGFLLWRIDSLIMGQRRDRTNS